MIIVTGKPRCGTSMMMHCLHQAGVPLAFKPTKGADQEKLFRNIYGFYEGAWNGEDGIIKCFSVPMFKKFSNPRFVYMQRDEDKMTKSWVAINPKVTEEQRAELKQKVAKIRAERLDKGLLVHAQTIDEVKNYQHIKVDYDTFVTNPEFYRKDFEDLFPELIFNDIISGIDNNLYINR